MPLHTIDCAKVFPILVFDHHERMGTSISVPLEVIKSRRGESLHDLFKYKVADKYENIYLNSNVASKPMLLTFDTSARCCGVSVSE